MNEILCNIRMRFRQTGELISSFKDAVRRGAGAYYKSIKNIERTRSNKLRSTRCADRCDLHCEIPRSVCYQRSGLRNQALTFQKIHGAIQKTTRTATDRFKKSDRFKMMIRKKLPGAKIAARESLPSATDHLLAHVLAA
ncbi:hypothetical protein [Bradyrhizobium sp. STM 3843]|uniref:hypothetical protein n=1 Tax=Bradyrhizobium sp. STM 3843 TaxID=551947 RepID=UPI001FCBA8F3|nr:hypothetical protein [Bradyrhizobium sp. STM 3843]